LAINNDDVEEIKEKESELSKATNQVSETIIKAIATIVLSQKND